MARKGENIRKRADGRWEGRYKNGVKENGMGRYVSVYGKTYTEVKNKLLEARRDAFHGSGTPCTEKKFEDLLAIWLETNQVRIKGATKAKYQHVIEKHIRPSLGKKRLSGITVSLINNFLYSKTASGRLDGRGGLSASYVKTMAIIIGSAMKFAVAEGYCPPLRNPIIKPPLVKSEKQILSVAAQRRFENYSVHNIDETVTGIYIALYAGLRIGEICALSWKDIDFSAKVLHVRHTLSRSADGSATLALETPKTKASVRDIPLSPVLLSVLHSMKGRSKSEYVVSSKNSYISTRTLEYRFKRLFSQLELPEINFHGLRHTFATRCVELGVDIKSLSQILGHANVAVTLNTYVHPSMDAMRKQLDKLQIVSVS